MGVKVKTTFEGHYCTLIKGKKLRIEKLVLDLLIFSQHSFFLRSHPLNAGLQTYETDFSVTLVILLHLQSRPFQAQNTVPHTQSPKFRLVDFPFKLLSFISDKNLMYSLMLLPIHTPVAFHSEAVLISI